jgi:uncharacterized LabA/DUF88 family protein
MRNVAVLIDGGHVRACVKNARLTYTPTLVVRLAHSALGGEERIFRIQYYDCEPFAGTVKLPVSGLAKQYAGQDAFLSTLACEELVAVRRGVLKFRGWERTAGSIAAGTPPIALTDADFKAKWEQKGVDLRIGLDMVLLTERRCVEIVILMTGDTDLIPAMKIARGRGLQVAGVALPNRQLIPELKPHCDFVRQVAAWPL